MKEKTLPPCRQTAVEQSAPSVARRETAKTGRLSKRHIARHDHDAERRVGGALLLVSHDLSFINNTTSIRWEICAHDTESVLEVKR